MREPTTAIDSETSLIMPGVAAPALVVVSACDGKEMILAKHDDPDLFPYLVDKFRGRTVFANAPFDLSVFIRHDERLIDPIFNALADGNVHDVQMTEKLNDLQAGEFKYYEDEEGNFRRKSYSLDAILGRWNLGRKHYGGRKYRLRFHDYHDTPLNEIPKDARDYAVTDAAQTWRLDQTQTPHPDAAHQVRAHFSLHLASCRGFRTDNKNVVSLHNQCTEWMDKIRPGLEKAKLLKPDGTKNTKVAVRRMIDVMGRNVQFTTKGEEKLLSDFRGDLDGLLKLSYSSGKLVSVATPSCIESGDDLLLHYGIYSKLSNMLTGSVKHLEAGTFLPIQTYFDPLMETGRTSSSGPNIQNQRRGIVLPHPFDFDENGKREKLVFHPDPRECFVAREGYALLACDYAGAENHTLAQSCLKLVGQSQLAAALNDGLDVHTWVASVILGCDYQTAAYRISIGDPEAQNARQLAKVANFGFPGGCGPARLVAFAKGMGVEIDEYLAAKLKAIWFKAWPEMRLYFEYISQCETDDGWYFVDHVNSPRIRGRATFTAACNSYFQGLAADGAKAAMWEVTRRQWCEPTSALYGTFIVNFVHDELILECPIGQLEAAARELREVMCYEFNKYTPDVPVHAEAEAMIHWTKNGQKVFDENDEYVWDLDKAA
jgi:hypothetical protein